MRDAWRWWTESWRAPGRARGIYLLMATAFGALALFAALGGEAAVAGIAALASIVTFTLSIAAPRLSRLIKPESDRWSDE